MNPKTNQQNRFFGWTLHALGLALTVLTVGLFYGVVYRPLDRLEQQYEMRTEQLDGMLKTNNSEGSEYRRLRARLNEMKQSVAELHTQLSQEFTEQKLLAEINGLATAENVQVLDYEIGAPQSLLTHTLTEVEFSCHGSYASICRFLEQAEQITKIAKLSKIELESRDNSRAYPVQLTFVLYSEGQSNDKREKRGVL